MTVRELIAVLSTFDQDLPVATVSTCECCTTIDEMDIDDIGVRCISDQDRHEVYAEKGADNYERIKAEVDAGLPAVEHRGVVIAGAGWASWGSGEAQ